MRGKYPLANLTNYFTLGGQSHGTFSDLFGNRFGGTLGGTLSTICLCHLIDILFVNKKYQVEISEGVSEIEAKREIWQRKRL